MPTNTIDAVDSSFTDVSVDFLGLKGEPRLTAGRSMNELYDRRGLHGHGVRVEGNRGTPVTLTLMKFVADNSAAKTHISDLAALKQAICTVYDELGDAWPNQLLADLSPPVQYACIVDGVAKVCVTHLATFVWVGPT